MDWRDWLHELCPSSKIHNILIILSLSDDYYVCLGRMDDMKDQEIRPILDLMHNVFNNITNGISVKVDLKAKKVIYQDKEDENRVRAFSQVFTMWESVEPQPTYETICSFGDNPNNLPIEQACLCLNELEIVDEKYVPLFSYSLIHSQNQEEED